MNYTDVGEPLDEADVRSVVRLLGETIAVEGGLASKRKMVMTGLCEIIDADAWSWSLVHLEKEQAPRQVMMTYDGIDEATLPNFLACVEHPDMKAVLSSFVEQALESGSAMGRCDAQFADWDALGDNPAIDNWNRAGLKSVILWAWPLRAGGYSGIGIYRSRDKPMFGFRETRITHILLSEIPWLHEEGWGRERGETLRFLSPRKREILHLLVQGNSRKQIANSLRLSLHWVNDCIKSIYRHFNVHSHAELISRFTLGDGGDINR